MYIYIYVCMYIYVCICIWMRWRERHMLTHMSLSHVCMSLVSDHSLRPHKLAATSL